MTEIGNYLPNNFNALPTEIQQKILIEMPLDKLLELRRVNKKFNETITNVKFLLHYQKNSKYKNQLTEEKLQKLILAKLYKNSGELEECEKAFIKKIVERLETKELCDCTDINSLFSTRFDQMPSFKVFEQQKQESDDISEEQKEALEKEFIEKLLVDYNTDVPGHYSQLLYFSDVRFISLVNKGVIQNKYYDYILMAMTKSIENSANKIRRVLNQNGAEINEKNRSAFTAALEHAEAPLFFLYLLSGNIDAVHSRWSSTDLPSKINDFLKILLRVEQADPRCFRLPYEINFNYRKSKKEHTEIFVGFNHSGWHQILVKLPALLSDIYLQHDKNESQVNYFKEFKNCLNKFYDKKPTSLINVFSREWTLSDEQIASLNDREKFNFFMIGLIAKNPEIVEKLGTACNFDKLKKEIHLRWESQMWTFVTNFCKGNEQALLKAHAANHSLEKKLSEPPYVDSYNQYYQQNVSEKRFSPEAWLAPENEKKYHPIGLFSKFPNIAGSITTLIGIATIFAASAFTMLTAIALPYLVAGMLVGSALMFLGLYLLFKPANILKESSSKDNEYVNPNDNHSGTDDTSDGPSQQPAPTVSSSTIFNVNNQDTDNTTANEPLPPNTPADNERGTSP